MLNLTQAVDCSHKSVFPCQSLSSGNRAGKRKRVIQTYDESELRRSFRDKPTKNSEPVLAKPGRKRKTDQAGPDVKRRKPGRPPGRGPGRPPILHSPDISTKGPLPPGWSVSLKESKKEIGRKFKQYKVMFNVDTSRGMGLQP